MFTLFFVFLSALPCSSAFSATLQKTNLITTWEPEAAMKIQQVAERRTNTESPLMIALVGIPGSGKSTSADILGDYLSYDEESLVFPHDGYHYSVDELKRFPDADAAIYRRGAPDTFDSGALLRDLRRIRYGQEDSVFMPGFDHAAGDPERDAHCFLRGVHDVVICEGLYLLHDEDGFEEVSDCFDMSIYVDANLDSCMDRLKVRNACIPGYTKEEIEFRVDAIDRKNAMTAARAKDRADIVVKSCAN